MRVKPLSAPEHSNLNEPGIFIAVIARPNVSGVARINSHDGLETTRTGTHTMFIKGSRVKTLWCAYYGPQILANSWQPFDQPSSAAYMPVPYDALAQIELG